MSNTICAISTAQGNGGIGIVRMSGQDCFEILNKIFIPKNGSKEIKGYSIKYGKIIDKDVFIDEVLVSYFVAPKSFTKENMCEINTHGGMVVERKILELCLKNGADLATPGEFTKRAFLNGRIDLSQAEAVMDLINSKTEKESKESAKQLEGSLSKKIDSIVEKLFSTITAIEVTVDYPEYDIEEVANRDAVKELKEIKEDLDKLKNSFNQGKLLKNGIDTVILGKPNAGKSSLLNALLKEDRAIVSNIEGTTRDTIEEQLNVNGILLNLVDTAGIRDTENEIEKIGVKKAKKLANEAELIIALFDKSRKFDDEDEEIIKIIEDKNVIIIINKNDVEKENKELEEKLNKLNKPIIKVSAKTGEGIEELYSKIEEMFKLNEISENNEIIITNERHKNQIQKAMNNVSQAIDSLEVETPVDISAIYIKQALEDLGEITGRNISEDIINEIFKNFCLGK